MKKIFSAIFIVILLLSLISCNYVDNDSKYADECVEKIYNAIQAKNPHEMKKIFSKKACLDSDDIEKNILDFFNYIKGEPISHNREESPVVFEDIEYGDKTVNEQFWFSVKTTDDVYSVFVSYYPIDDIEPDNKGLYSMLVIRASDENKLVGSINEWSSVAGIRIYNE